LTFSEIHSNLEKVKEKRNLYQKVYLLAQVFRINTPYPV